MIIANDFIQLCVKNEFTFFSGTPCSYLKPLINEVIDNDLVNYHGAVNEGDAIAMVCGAYLTGNKGVAIFQNSGLGNAVNALTSLSYPFRFPFMMIVTHRGQPGGPADEPQHELMGAVTEDVLTAMQIKWEYFPDNQKDLESVFQRANQYMAEFKLPFALIMRKGSVAPRDLKKKKSDTPIGKRTFKFEENISLKYSDRSTRIEALKLLHKYRRSNDVIVATTGKTGRELYTIEDSGQNLYMVGSMGSASSFSLGAAICNQKQRWVTIDGDAAALMRMGNLASVGAYHPDNFLHIILDNEVNDSTGGQQTISDHVSLAAVAQACGYESVFSSDQLKELELILAGKLIEKGPVLIHFRIKKGSPSDLGRPKIKPYEVKNRLMQFLKVEPSFYS